MVGSEDNDPVFVSRRKQVTSKQVEAIIRRVWDEKTSCGHVSGDTTFFEAGGTSSQLMRVHKSIVEELDQTFDITVMFETPRLRELSERLTEIVNADASVTSSHATSAPEEKIKTDALPDLPDTAVAIVGLGARLPGADSIDEFWNHLRQGKNLIEPHDPETLEDNFTTEQRSAKNYVPVRPDLPDAGMFDAKFFSMYPREAAITDPQARVFLEICYEALEDSGHDPLNMKVPVGVFAGSAANTYLMNNVLGDRAQVEDYTSNYQTGKFAEWTGNWNDCLATRVSFKLNLNGPAMTVQTACSSSLTAIGQAIVNLRSGLCDVALAGGVSITFPQKRGYVTQEGGLSSDDGTCRPFDAKASGTVFSHGAGVVVLRRLVDAVKDNDQIYAVIRGVGINNDGADKISYTAPSVRGQSAAVQLALKDAELDANSISYIECHGTATPLGDPIEINGLKRAFGDGLNEGSCAIGSVKGNIGHLDAAAGVVSVIKTALMLQHRELPPVANFSALNPNIDFSGTPFRIPAALEAWDTTGPRRAGVSSFGVGGTNAHVVLEEAPTLSVSRNSDSIQIIPLSAKTPTALSEMQQRLADQLESANSPHLSDIAYTAQESRTGLEFRSAVAGCDAATVADALRNTRLARAPAMEGDPPVSFMFPGQGSQYPGMGSGLYADEPTFAHWIDRGAEILRPILGLDVKTMLCFGDPDDEDAARALRDTRLTQPALFLTQFACAKLWMERGVHPKALIGHSVGEFTAAALADVMDFETGLRIIAKRGELMQSQPGGAMLSVRASMDAVTSHLDDSVDVAARNAPQLNVLAGSFEAIDKMEERLKAADIPCTRLHTSHAFHSVMMDPVCGELETALAGLKLNSPSIPYVSCVTGTWIADDECTNPAYWAQQARATVNFETAISELTRSTPAILLEVGAGATLSAFAKQTLARDAQVAVVQSLPDHTRRESDTTAMANGFGQLWCAGASIDWEKLGQPGQRRVSLPTYPFERKLHWIDAPVPTNRTAHNKDDAHMTDVAPTSIETTNEHSKEILTMTTLASDQTADRRPRLIGELIDMLSNISGEDLVQDDADTSFLNLGFDSLFLGQVSQKLSADYGVELSFRELLSTYPTISDVAAFLDEKLPPEPVAVEPVQPTEEPPQQVATQSLAVQSNIVEQTLPVSAGVAVNADSSVTALMQAQLSAMQHVITQQIGALSGGVPVQSHMAPDPVPMKEQPAPSTTVQQTEPRAEKDNEPEPVQVPKEKQRFSIGRATNASGGELTSEQLAFAKDLATRYSERSPKSKAYVQKYRHVLADPRTAAGFRAEWKELVYPVVSDRSKGAQIWDIDGNEYVDLVNGFGQTAFGHSPDFVIEAVSEQMERGFAIGPQTDLVGPVAERFANFVGHQRATFCNTGSEAVMAAMRLARTVTGRERIVVFGNDYHGQFDEVLVKGRGGRGAPSALPIAPGIPRSSLSNVVVLPYDDPNSLEWIKDNIDTLAGVLVEPVQSRHPDLRPREFVRSLRDITQTGGAALIIDEVVTGFRVGPRGMQGIWDIQPDMATYGKVIGGGMPIGMLAGSARFMDALDGGMWQFGDDSVPEAMPTFFAGTFVRHPLVVAAVSATLDHLEDHGEELWTDTANRTAEAVAKMNGILSDRGLPSMLETYSSWFVPQVTNYDPNAALLFPLMRQGGVHVQIGYPWIFTTAHKAADYQKVIDVFEQSVDALQSVGILTSGEAQAPQKTPDAPSPKTVSTPPQIEAAPTKAIPLTAAQREIWMTNQLGELASCSFNESASLDLIGPLDTEALQAALNQVVARHDGLRQVFHRTGETFDILDPFEVPFELHDLSNEGDEDAFRNLLAQDSAAEIDIVTGPPLRAFLVRKAPEHHVLVINAHHLVCDGWSINVVSQDLATLYTHEVIGTEPDLPLSPSFAAMAKTAHQTPVPLETKEYWKSQFDDTPELPELPTDRARPALKSFSGATCSHHISEDVTRAARKAGAAQGCTLFATLFASLQIVIGRLSGSDDVVLGVPTGGQALLENSDLVGHCVNFLPIRAKQQPDATVAEHLTFVRDQVMNAFDHQGYTFGSLVQDLEIPRTLNRLPLTEIQFNLERLGESIEMGPLRMSVAPNPKTSTNFDLFFNIIERSDGLRVDVDYNTDLFDQTTIERWIGHLETVLSEIAADAQQSVSTIPVQTPEERTWIAETLNETAEALPGIQTIHQLFSQKANETPDKVALEFGDQTMTYGQLDARSDIIATALRKSGVGTRGRVAVALARSPECVAALLGVMKSGNAYVPLDPAQPTARLRMILEQASVSALIHDQVDLPDYASDLEMASLPISDMTVEEASVIVDVSGDDSAYVMFTSGSTGAPKGVEIGHRSAVNLLMSMAREPGFDVNGVLLAVTTTTFDISVLELFLPLLQGGRTVIASQEDVLSGYNLVARLDRGDITHMQATPTLWQMVLEAGFEPKTGFTMLAGGEPLPPDLAAKLMSGGATLWNVYGPTETTIWSAASHVQSADQITIGHPIANTSMYILGGQDQLLPLGAVGELNIGGTGLAKGYLNRQDLTDKAFRRVSVNGRNEVLYKTGDLAQRLPDGSIKVLGRSDNQIKLRGFRIELGDVETALRAIDGVTAAAAAVKTTEHGDKRLVGYIVAETGHDLSQTTLHQSVSQKLPGYMVPNAWVFLSTLPQTANGKTDRKALPGPDVSATVTAFHVDPKTPTEEQMAKIWCDVLGEEKISTTQTLFSLGADSLTVFRIAARMIDAGMDLEGRHLLQYPSIAQLATFADSKERNATTVKKPSLKDYRRGSRTRSGV